MIDGGSLFWSLGLGLCALWDLGCVVMLGFGCWGFHPTSSSPLAPALLPPAFPILECLPPGTEPLVQRRQHSGFPVGRWTFYCLSSFLLTWTGMTGSFALGWLQDYGTHRVNPGIPNYADGGSSLKLPRVKEKQRNKFRVPNFNSLIKSMQSFDKSHN